LLKKSQKWRFVPHITYELDAYKGMFWARVSGDHPAPAQPLDYLEQAIRPPHPASLAPRHLATRNPPRLALARLTCPFIRTQNLDVSYWVDVRACVR